MDQQVHMQRAYALMMHVGSILFEEVMASSEANTISVHAKMPGVNKIHRQHNRIQTQSGSEHLLDSPSTMFLSLSPSLEPFIVMRPYVYITALLFY